MGPPPKPSKERRRLDDVAEFQAEPPDSSWDAALSGHDRRLDMILLENLRAMEYGSAMSDMPTIKAISANAKEDGHRWLHEQPEVHGTGLHPRNQFVDHCFKGLVHSESPG